MKVSFIIPIYNVERYLQQCVNSILNQTYRNIEVILVDDGSTDGCPVLCDQLATEDSRVKVLHKPNGGLSDARNAGTDIAIGDYIIYMDSDDFWSSNDDLQNLVAVAQENPQCDFIGFNCSYYYEVNQKISPWPHYDKEIQAPINSKDCIDKLVLSGVFPMSACMKMIKRECVKGKIKFIKGIYSEDIPWFIELLKKSHKCMFLDQYIYVYRKGIATSISGSFSYKKYSDLFRILREGVEINKTEPDGKVRDALYSFWAYELCILRSMTGFIEKKPRCEALKNLYEYDWLFDYKLHPKVRKVAFVQKYLGKTITNYILHRYLRTRLA